MTNFDIDPFVPAITIPGALDRVFLPCDCNGGDLDGDGVVLHFEIDALFARLVAVYL